MKKIITLFLIASLVSARASAQTSEKYSIQQVGSDSAKIEALCFDGKPFKGSKKELAEKIKIDTLADERLALLDRSADTTYLRPYVLLVQNKEGYWEKVCYLPTIPSSARIVSDNKSSSGTRVVFREPGYRVDSEFVRVTFETDQKYWLSQWVGP